MCINLARFKFHFFDINTWQMLAEIYMDTFRLWKLIKRKHNLFHI